MTPRSASNAPPKDLPPLRSASPLRPFSGDPEAFKEFTLAKLGYKIKYELSMKPFSPKKIKKGLTCFLLKKALLLFVCMITAVQCAA